MSASTQATPNPDVNVSGMKPSDASVEVQPKQGGGQTLSPLPVGGRRRKSKKASRRRRGGAEHEVAPVGGAKHDGGAKHEMAPVGGMKHVGGEGHEGARRRRKTRKTRKGKKGGVYHT